MKTILNILKLIENESSRNGKESILYKHRNNELLKEILCFNFDPFILTGIADKKLSKFKNVKVNHGFNSILDVMEYLKINNTGTDEVIKRVVSFIEEQDEELQEFYKQLVTKSIKIGANVKSLNKVFGKGFITEFSCMLAKNYFEEEHKIKGDFIITEKIDGGRMLLIKENGVIKCFSRKGQPIVQLIEIEEEAKHLPDNYVFDGEVLKIDNGKLSTHELYRETMKIVRKDGIKKNICFHVFDMLPLDEFKNGRSKDIAIIRKEKVKEVLDNFNFIKPLPMLYVGNDKDKVTEYLNRVVSEGKEGVMVNDAEGYYETKRTDSLLKVKKMHTIDLKIVGVERGTGKFANTLGRINCEYKGSILGVGSGFTEEDRDFIFNNQDKVIGKIAEIQYFEESQNQDGGVSLRFPVFVRLREDKDDVSYY